MDLDSDRLIGTAEFAELIDVPVKTMQWFRVTDGYDFPETEVRIDKRGTWIVRASTALAWARERERYDGPVPDPMPLPDLVSTGYICEHTGRMKKTVQAWQHRGELPEPYAVVSRSPVWLAETIDAWWAARNGQPSEADQRQALVAALTKETP